jgi:hypothetical protein
MRQSRRRLTSQLSSNFVRSGAEKNHYRYVIKQSRALQAELVIGLVDAGGA